MMMKNCIVLFFILTVFLSCNQKITEKDLSKINGYWEIEKVNFPDGNDKDYKVNSAIDYFEIKNNIGFRQKVLPQFNGKYITNGIIENIKVTNESGVFYLNCATNFSKWKDEIVTLKDSVLILKNNENLEYHYKRQVPFSVK